jgi:ADP-L-glycero-D-manno-heptose 6-epimerase
MVVLVTGHKGFIGKNLFKKFTKYLLSVIGIDEDYNKDYIINFLNIHNPDVVFHIGACSDTLNTDVEFVMERNYLSTKWITDWCFENSKKIIYASSAAVYGFDGDKPSNLYGWSKLIGEDYVVAKGGVALRYFNVYGPGEEHKGKMSSMVYQNFNNSEVKLFPDKPRRDFVYVEDIVSANLYALENYDRLKGSYYEVGSGESSTFETVFDNLGLKYTYLDKSEIPEGYQFKTLSLESKWMPGWKPEFNLEKGIKQYKEYLNEKS